MGSNENADAENPVMYAESCGSGAPVQSNSRWNPTKEQINVLESLYRQGIKTPTADQIQQITARLRTFGHIEGKNVFYWFQNHKARQRQKQKQEKVAFFHRFLPHHHNHQPLNVCSPYYLPQHDPAFYQQHHPKMMLPPVSFKRVQRSPASFLRETTNAKSSDPETLPLFPLNPTGILEEKEKERSLTNDSERFVRIYDQTSPAINWSVSNVEQASSTNSRENGHR